jgi:type II secretory pathway component PulK
MLNIDGATARKIRGSLPVPRLFEDQTAASEKRWLAGVDELVSRGFLTQEQLDRVDPALFTTYTVSDHAKPERFLNVNAAPAPVLAALFDVPLETAEAAMAQRPFLSLADMEPLPSTSSPNRARAISFRRNLRWNRAASAL